MPRQYKVGDPVFHRYYPSMRLEIISVEEGRAAGDQTYGVRFREPLTESPDDFVTLEYFLEHYDGGTGFESRIFLPESERAAFEKWGPFEYSIGERYGFDKLPWNEYVQKQQALEALAAANKPVTPAQATLF